MSPAATHEATSLPGISSLIAEANRKLRIFAEDDDAPVFITGEQGTEKAFAAKVVHLLSSRASQPLFKLSVSYKLPPDLAGRFLQANGGTLILNLQREFPPDMQYTLLEMMTDRAFADPLSGELIEADVRIVLTTSLDMRDLAGGHELLPELHSLLKSNHVEIPPIRERTEDIPALVRYATNRALETGRSRARGADAQVLALFRKWEWPGNAEDLLLVTAEAALNAKGELITLDDLPAEFLSSVSADLVEQARKVRLPDPAPAALKAPEPPPPAVPEPAKLVASVARGADGTPATPEEIDAEARRLQRLIALARRLNTQSQMLARQMSGPLDRRFVNPEALLERGADVQGELASALESEIDRGLDAILSLRRQLARLNQREKETILTARDLYRRLLMAGQNITGVFEEEELKQETAVLADSLREMDTIIQHVSGSFPKLQDDDPPISGSAQMHEEEARAIEETLKRARERERERRQAAAAAAMAAGLAAAAAAEAEAEAVRSGLDALLLDDELNEDELHDDFEGLEDIEETALLAPAPASPPDRTTAEEPDETGPMPILPDARPLAESAAARPAPPVPLPAPPPPAPSARRAEDETDPGPRPADENEKTVRLSILAETQFDPRPAGGVRHRDDEEETNPMGFALTASEEDTATGLNIDDFESAFDEVLDQPPTFEAPPQRDPSDTKEQTRPGAPRATAAEDDTVAGLRAEDFASAFEDMFDEGKTEEIDAARAPQASSAQDDTQPVVAPSSSAAEEDTLAADFMSMLDEAFGEDEKKK